MKKIDIDFVLFDLIGTTVKDSYNGESLILDNFHRAFLSNGYSISYEKLNLQRGKSKLEAIRSILFESGLDMGLTHKIYSDFIQLLNESLVYFSEIDGAAKVFEYLKGKSVKIGIGSGLPMDFMTNIFKQIGWRSNLFDYIGSADSLGKGRPDPIMIFDSIKKLKIESTNRVLKVGDTLVDIQEGKNANVLTAMVLTGTQTREDIGDLAPDFILEDINDLMRII